MGGAGIRQSGYRYPKHIGARVQGNNEITVLAAVPLFAGESLVRQELDFHWVSQADEAADQLHHVVFGVLATPFEWASDTITNNLSAGVLDIMAEGLHGSTSGTYDWAPDPNPGADSNWQGKVDAGIGGSEMIYEWAGWAKAKQFALDDTLIGGDQMINRTEASHKKVISKNHFYPVDMVVMYYAARTNIAAQTDFGVAEIDATAEEMDLFNALERGLSGGQAGTDPEDKMIELIYGGDKYIEADTIKTTTGVGYFSGSFTIATPWPVTLGAG